MGHLGLDMTTTAYSTGLQGPEGSYGVRMIYNGMNASISNGHNGSGRVGYTNH